MLLIIECVMMMLRILIPFVLLLQVNCAVGQYYDNVTLEAGIVHQYNNGFLGGGVSMCDFDGDGLDDISICQRNVNPIFYRNTGGSFVQVPYLISNDKEMKQITWVDYDNDGDKDLFTTSLLASVKLYKNEGGLSMVDLTSSAGFPSTSNYTFGNCWADYDLDGDLDVYISNYNGIGFGDPTVTNLLYRNNGDDTFTDVTFEAGVDGDHCYTFMSLWLDLNGDLWPDLYSINDRYECRDYLYVNNGDGTFTDVTIESGVLQNILSMNISAEDYDNDGDFDLYISNGTEGCSFFRHEDGDVFTQVASSNGTVLNVFCWGTQFVDGNNDMWQDMFVSSTPHQATTGQDRFLLNNHDGTFSNITNLTGFAAEVGWNRSVASADYNDDGFADLFTAATLPTYSSLLRATPNDNKWLKVQLQGVISNRDGISSRIECYAGGLKQSRYTYCGEAYLAQNSTTEIFGLAQFENADSLIVKWPSGIIDKWYNIPSGQKLHLVEGTSRAVNVQYLPQFCQGDSILVQADIWSTYSWSSGDTTSEMLVDQPGTYLLTVSDQFGNHFQSEPIAISYFPEYNYVMSVHDPTCADENNGWLAIENADWLPNQFWMNDSLYEGANAFDLIPGLYHISLIDEYGCLHHENVEITNPQPLSAEALVTQPPCHGEHGQAMISVTGEQGGYVLQLGSQDLSDLSVGHYDFTITDGMNCVTTVAFDIVEPAAIQAQLTTTEVQCAGEQNGSVEVENISGGTGAINIEPNYEGLGLAAGQYTITLLDEMGCSLELPFEILEPSPLVVSVSTEPEYELGNLGSAEVIVQGGIPPYSFIWSSLTQTDSIATDLASGNYNIIVEDMSECSVNVEFVIDFIAGIHELKEIEFMLFPNPALDGFYLYHTSPVAADKFVVLDITGNVVLEESVYSWDKMLDISSLAVGTYIFHINTNGREISLPFMKLE